MDGSRSETFTEEVLRLWSAWPDIPESVMEWYRSGAVDNDPGVAERIMQLSSVKASGIEYWLIIGCEKYAMYRIIGCFCYQCARLIDCEVWVDLAWGDCLLQELSVPKSHDPELTRDLTWPGHLEWQSRLTNLISILSTYQLRLFLEILEALLDRLESRAPQINDSFMNETLDLEIHRAIYTIRKVKKL
ncbi:hypothetical protein CCB80_11915 [Armatimonadetes bacterium Uphvl-Ar1]|nr:hypothetical protein CCB80_11915 [Armatimonadetes bacterium Uphvl-Ar1]